MSSLSSISGTKLSQHTHTSSPTGTKLSPHTHTSSPTGTKLSQHAKNCPFQPVLPEQGELCTAATTKKSSRENFLPHPAPPPIQNSPNTPTPAAQPVQNSPNTPKIAHFSPFCPSRENFVPPPPPRSRAGRTFYRTQRHLRYKTLPTHPHQQPNRYKTLPTHPKLPISARFARAGRTLYRSHHHAPQQGELCTAPSAKPGTKLSQHPRSTAVPRKSSPSTPHTTTEPRKSSPCTPKNGVFRLFRPCRANFFAHKQATSHTGRIISRTGDRTGSADEGCMR